LIPEDAALELEARKARAMEQLPMRRRVVQEARIPGERLTTRSADVRDVIPASKPSAVAARPDLLPDDGQRIRRSRRIGERPEAARQESIVPVDEGQPVAADQLKAPVPSDGYPHVGIQGDEDDA
jgi:hypothetical protein